MVHGLWHYNLLWCGFRRGEVEVWVFPCMIQTASLTKNSIAHFPPWNIIGGMSLWIYAEWSWICRQNCRNSGLLYWKGCISTPKPRDIAIFSYFAYSKRRFKNSDQFCPTKSNRIYCFTSAFRSFSTVNFSARNISKVRNSNNHYRGHTTRNVLQSKQCSRLNAHCWRM